MGLDRCRRCRADSESSKKAFFCPPGHLRCELFYQEPWLELMVKLVIGLSVFIGIADLVINGLFY